MASLHLCERTIEASISRKRPVSTSLQRPLIAQSTQHYRSQSRKPAHHALVQTFSVQSQRRRALQRICALGPAGNKIELPIFPLNSVAFPGVPTPLVIFEARYRVLFSTLLAGQEGIEEGLVDWKSPFCGSKKFGLSYSDKNGNCAGVGTILEIQEHARVADRVGPDGFKEPDGRLLIQNKGVQRYRILNVKQQRPVLIAEVELLAEDGDTSEEATALATKLAGQFRELLRLNFKYNSSSQVTEEQLDPAELRTLAPQELSYWVASVFAGNQLLQQNLLEEDTTVKRLQLALQVVEGTLKWLSATYALKSAFDPTAKEAAPPASTDAPSASASADAPPSPPSSPTDEPSKDS